MIATLENELVDFIWDNYPVLKDHLRKEQVGWLLKQHSDRVIIVRDLGTIKGIGFYLRLTDKTYEDLKDRKISLRSGETLKSCLVENGNNIHFGFAVADGFKTIMKGLRQVIENEKPQTISWSSPDMTDFFERRIM